MTLPGGTLLGPYEIVAPIGSGGMGSVYRARDTRLGRDVAIKVMTAASSDDPERIRRFQQEATATGLLNHPNLLAIYDVGTFEGSPYLVSELLEGANLRERLDGSALPVRKALDYAQQITRGLAAAHDKGVVHRDLKPENLFITRDGRVKILDFGLAKLNVAQPGSVNRDAATITVASDNTGPGVVLGTVGYMSPEQVRGQVADHRADLFAFGAILYEMVSGRRAFRRDSAIETMNAILKEDPPELLVTGSSMPPDLDRVMRRCLEKSPDERFQSASDLAFALEGLSGLSESSTSTRIPASRRRMRWLLPALGLAGCLALVGAGAYWAGRWVEAIPPVYSRQSFRQGFIVSARFAPAGESMLFSAAWGGRPIEIFSTRSETPESRALGVADAGLFAVSSTGDLALALRQHLVKPFVHGGTLATMSLGGGAPREICEDIQWADWSSDGKSLAVVRDVAGRNCLEFPLGTVLYRSSGWISDPRVSPDRDQIAFLDHQAEGDWHGSIVLTDFTGKSRTLYTTTGSIFGLAWSAKGDEVWFTASEASGGKALFASDLAGHARLVLRVPGSLRLFDVARTGHVLLSRDNNSSGLAYHAKDQETASDLSWLDSSLACDLSADGKMVLITERGEGGGLHYSVYLRKTDGSTAVRLGEGYGLALSPDGKWALALQHMPTPHFVLFPTGSGEQKQIGTGKLILTPFARWFPDGSRILYVGNDAGHGAQVFVQNVAGGAPRPITPAGTWGGSAISPDGKQIATVGPDRRITIYPSEGGVGRPVPGTSAGDWPIQWSADGAFLYAYRMGELPGHLSRIAVESGKKEPLHPLMPSDPAGIVAIGPVQITADGNSYVYTYHRVLSELYLVTGLK
jgi:eukaryotic-like serine/threonine-protein kinase